MIKNNITISWNSVNDANSYIIYVDGILNETATNPSQNVMFHINGTYSIAVSAVNSYGESRDSTPIIIKVEIPDTEAKSFDWKLLLIIIGSIGLVGITIFLIVRFVPKKELAQINTVCPHCGNYCSPNARSCPQCGELFKKRQRIRNKKKKNIEPTVGSDFKMDF